MHDTHSLDIPEGLRLDYEVAGLGSRFLAALVDTIILFSALGMLMWAAFFALFVIAAGFGARTLPDGDPDLSGVIYFAVLAVLVPLVLWGYYVVFEMLWSGQSPGKRVFALRVVGHDGYPVTFAASLVRNLVRIIDFLPVYYGLGMLVMFIDAKSRRLGDFAAGTVVVKERVPMSSDELLTDFDESLEPDEPIPNVERLGQRERFLIDSVLSRYQEMTPAHRVALARSVAARIAAVLEYDPGSLAPARFLRRVQQSYRPQPDVPRIEIPNVERLTSAEYGMIREYFLRCGSLPVGRARQLARQIAEAIARKLELDPDAVGDAEAFLRQVGDAYRGAQRPASR